MVLPIWSAATDPCVLAARALPLDVGAPRAFDARAAGIRTVRGPDCEHIVIDLPGNLIRIDVVAGTTGSGPVTLRFDLANDDRLDFQIAAIQAFRSVPTSESRHLRMARKLLALQAKDARDAGASMREIADAVLGPGEWPGNGEHRKSLVRRMIASGDAMVRTGPRRILAAR
jgi:hypothetical protein